jgi:hypothetical protein
METIRTSGNYIAVKVPEESHGFSYDKKYGCLFYQHPRVMMGFVCINHAGCVGAGNVIDDENFKIIGLISDISKSLYFTNNDIGNLCHSIMCDDWNQWLIIEKKG